MREIAQRSALLGRPRGQPERDPHEAGQLDDDGSSVRRSRQLDGVSLVVIGGSQDLDASSRPRSTFRLHDEQLGYFVAAAETFSLGPADALLDLDFTDAYNKTIVLVHNFRGTVNGDLDADDDCVLDSTPWDTDLGSINWLSGGDTNCTYGAVAVGPDGDFSPAHAYICDAANGVWGIGTFAADDEAAADTPGADNPQDCDTTDCEEAVSRGLDAVASDPADLRSDCCSNWTPASPSSCRELTYDATAPAIVDVSSSASIRSAGNGEYINRHAPNRSMTGHRHHRR